jgi:sugar phosphate isomerase/epimerase
MKLGFVSAILPDHSLGELFELAQSIRYDCIELMCWPRGRAERRYAGITHIDASALDSAECDRIRRLQDSTRVSISALGYYPNLLSPDGDTATVCRDHLLRVIDAAATLRVPTVNTFIGRDRQRSVDENWGRMLETWRPILAHAESCGVRIGIENCPMFFSHDEWPGGNNLAVSPAIWRRIFRDLPGAVLGLNYDPSHLLWQQIDPAAPLKEFGPRVFHVHAKDARVDREKLNDVGILATPLEYHSPKLPGLGDVDWRRFFAALTDCGYRGPVCVEVEDRAYEHSTEGRIAALRQSANYLRQFIAQ